MRTLLKVLLLCCCTFTAARAQGWKGIVPLHSTRADVERLLGPGRGECKCHYELYGDGIRVEYAKAPCAGYPSGWNVPADTVLTVEIDPGLQLQFSQLSLDESKYEKDYDDTLQTYYSSREEGIQYVVASLDAVTGVENLIRSIRYVPSSKDAHLRCPCFPPEDGSIFRTPPWDQFAGESYEDSLARLDNFAAQLLQEPLSKGYVIVYAAKQTAPARAKAYVRRFKEYLTKKRGLSAEKVSVTYGGYRDLLTVEDYIFRYDMPPPKPRPTYEPCGQEAK
jgi:hypothetical protein